MLNANYIYIWWSSDIERELVPEKCKSSVHLVDVVLGVHFTIKHEARQRSYSKVQKTSHHNVGAALFKPYFRESRDVFLSVNILQLIVALGKKCES